MRPSYHPEGLYDEEKMTTRSKDSTSPITQLWHMNGRCPEDTIPVRRTKKDDVLRASSVKKYGKKKPKAIAKPRSTDPDLTNESGHQVENHFLISLSFPWRLCWSPYPDFFFLCGFPACNSLC